MESGSVLGKGGKVMETSEILERLDNLKRVISNMVDPPFPASVPGDIEALGAAIERIKSMEGK
ncbi:MAG TPA: hypothetical protein DIC46_15055 [Porphyromonadaceae bacterium]|jgi:hypothetical protein|nr:hypothetical protein [Porphyromonadaceae bacterium]